ncbi:MAG: amine oxidase, partial [Burkholderiaceae bacterium]
GLAPLARHLAAPALAARRVRPVSVERIERLGTGTRLYGLHHATDGEATPVVVNARLAIVAAPLPIAARMVPELAAPWANSRAAAGDRAPWTVANIVFRRPPVERDTGGDDLLAWDNVVHGSPALGFVNAAHQMIRIDTTGPLVLTAYRAYPATDREARAELRRLLELGSPAPAREWLALVGPDLVAAYGSAVWRDVVRVQVTVRGHGMSAPAPGFLDEPLLHALRRETGPVRYAHSDLSGYSVFEEALWWGTRAAHAIGA